MNRHAIIMMSCMVSCAGARLTAGVMGRKFRPINKAYVCIAMSLIRLVVTWCIDTIPYDTGLEAPLGACSLLVVPEVLKCH